MSRKTFEKYIYDHIPVTASLGFKVLQYDNEVIRIKAPLNININHRQSAFGGSISSLLIMTAWGYVYSLMENIGQKGTIVIQNSQVEYYKPISSDFIAVNRKVTSSDLKRFTILLKKFSKARLHIESVIEENNQVLAEFKGSFVVVKK